MKPFRFYLTYQPDRPTKTVADYSPDELDRFVHAFGRSREMIRRWNWRLFVVFGIALTVTAMLCVPGDLWIEWSAAFVICFLVIITLWKFPHCPACRNELEAVVGPYCPECGERALQRAGWLPIRTCTACGIAISPRKGRNFRVRNCSICGVKVDENGI